MKNIYRQHYDKLNFFVVSILFILMITAQCSAQSYPFKIKKTIYHKGWIDLNKNGKMDPYENPNLPVDKRIDDLLSRMNINEKTCQLVTLYGYGAVLTDQQPTKAWLDTTWKDGIANIDEQLNGGRKESNLLWPPSLHAEALNNVQRFFIEQTRLGIPVDFTNEGISGLKAYKATSFPDEIGQGSTWDPELINQIGKVEGEEARALGYTNVYSPEMDISRDPRWGRVLSTYGEEPYLLSKLGVAMVKGIQGEHVVSTLKHFAVYSVPKGGRDGAVRTDPHVTPRELYTLFLPPFETAVKADALGVMSSYNDYNGIPITGSYYFLTEILRKKFDFKGYIVTDSGALQDIYAKHHVQNDYKGAVIQALEAGVNVCTAFQNPSVFLTPLRQAVRDGELPMRVLNQRVREVLRVKFWLGLFDNPYVNTSKSNWNVNKLSSIALSLHVAEESLVLLKNSNNVLPLDKNKIHSILVTGPNATMTSLMNDGYGPTGIQATTVLDGIKNEIQKGTNITYVKGPDIIDNDFPESDIMETPLSEDEKVQIQEAVSTAKQSDVAIVVVGEDNKTVGESRSRVSLKLPGHQLALVKAVYETGTPTVVILLNGQPLSINWINKNVPAILEAWFPGAKAGEAIAKTIFGENNPGGKLPITFPKAVGQVPLNFPYMPSSQSYFPDDPKDEAQVTGPLYPFGYGLSYTQFKFSDLQITPLKQNTGGNVEVSLNVKNIGKLKGDEVVQLYIHEKTTPVIVPVSELRGFKRITLEPGQSQKVQFELTPQDLQLLNQNLEWEVVPGSFDVMIGNSSIDIKLKGKFEVTGNTSNKAYGL